VEEIREVVKKKKKKETKSGNVRIAKRIKMFKIESP